MRERVKALDPFERTVDHEGARVCARGRIPEDLELFLDHFPDFPVLPGVLTLEILKRTIVPPPRGVRVAGLKAVRFQSFLKPGDEWHSQSERVSAAYGQEIWKVRLDCGSVTAVSARVTLKFEGGSEAYGR